MCRYTCLYTSRDTSRDTFSKATAKLEQRRLAEDWNKIARMFQPNTNCAHHTLFPFSQPRLNWNDDDWKNIARMFQPNTNWGDHARKSVYIVLLNYYYIILVD
jgi:hypothetical protein